MAEVGGHESAQALQEARLRMTSAHGGQGQDRTILTLFTLGGRRNLKREISESKWSLDRAQVSGKQPSLLCTWSEQRDMCDSGAVCRGQGIRTS